MGVKASRSNRLLLQRGGIGVKVTQTRRCCLFNKPCLSTQTWPSAADSSLPVTSRNPRLAPSGEVYAKLFLQFRCKADVCGVPESADRISVREESRLDVDWPGRRSLIMTLGGNRLGNASCARPMSRLSLQRKRLQPGPALRLRFTAIVDTHADEVVKQVALQRTANSTWVRGFSS